MKSEFVVGILVGLALELLVLLMCAKSYEMGQRAATANIEEESNARDL